MKPNYRVKNYVCNSEMMKYYQMAISHIPVGMMQLNACIEYVFVIIHQSSCGQKSRTDNVTFTDLVDILHYC